MSSEYAQIHLGRRRPRLVGVLAGSSRPDHRTIIALDVVDQQFVLGDGSVYALPKSVRAASLVLGSNVKVTFTSSDGTNTATAVVRAK